MILRHLEVRGIRNIRHQVLELDPGLNVFLGRNGSGKSSLLEAIHVLGTGRGYRGHHSPRLITDGLDEAVVFGRLDQENDRGASIGVSRHRDGSVEYRISGKRCERASELAEAFPVLLIAPETLQFLEHSPGERRRFVNWGVFHVKPEFLGSWRRAQYYLQQRNALLKHANIDSRLEQIWSDRYAEAAESVDAYSQDYLAVFTPLFIELMAEVTGLKGLDLSYQRGWPRGESLADSLRRSMDADVQRGFTRFGHHRADFKLLFDGSDASRFLSRGQLKLAAVVMTLSQGALLQRHSGKACLLLIDDLGSELDGEHRARLAEVIKGFATQIVFTAIDGATSEAFWAGTNKKVFHVEQGTFVTAADVPPQAVTKQ